MTNYQSTSITEEIKGAITFDDVFRYFNVTPQKIKERGSECTCSCPLPSHKDKNPSFSYNKEKKIFKCHGCQASGDVYHLIALLAGYDIKSNFSIVMDIARSISGRPSGELTKKNTEFFKKSYSASIMSPAIVKEKSVESYLERKKVNVGMLDIEWGAICDNGNDFDIVVPMRDQSLTGEVVGAQRGKKKFIANSTVGLFYEPKYINSESTIYVVEGLSDWLTMISCGITNTIGLGSASMNTDRLSKALSKYRVVNIALDMDLHKEEDDRSGSKTGLKKTRQLVERMKTSRGDVRIFSLGAEYKYDINDIYKSGEKQAVINFFSSHQLTLQEISEHLDDSAVSNKAYEYARRMHKENYYAIDVSKKFFWMCDKETNVWSMIGRSDIEREVMMFIEKKSSAGHNSGMIVDVLNYLSRVTNERVVLLREFLEKGGNDTFDISEEESVYINLRDGKYFPFSGEVKPYVPEDCVFSTLTLSIKDVVDLPDRSYHFSKFMKSLFKGDSDAKEKENFIQEWIGYLLIPKNVFQKMLLILGAGGNGKSTLLNCVSDILGPKNFTNVEINDLARNRFAPSALLGAYANLCTDIDKKSQLNSDILKKITGGDVMTAEKKFEALFQFKPFARIIMASNSDPYSSDGGDWLRRRLQMIEFNQSFIGREDFFLEEKLRKETRFIFAWATEGLKRLIKRGYFLEPPSSEKRRDSYIESLDYIKDFEEYMKTKVKQPGIQPDTSVYNLYSLFRFYMENYEGRSNKFVPSKRTFVSDMIGIGYKLVKREQIPHLVKEEEVDLDDFDFD